MLADPRQIRSIVFDLDGTLYTSAAVAREIENVAYDLVARSRGVPRKVGQTLVRAARRQLTETLEEEPTLTLTLMELGIEVKDFHRTMQESVHPERYLAPDLVLYALLDSLRSHCDLFIYTNNNLSLTRKILALLGVEDLFERLFTIEYSGVPKPDGETLQRLMADIGGPPETLLFIGDRHQVDLKLPAALGVPTLLVNETADLLQIHKLLGIVP
jgi:putative hydrolase of the HAD superfamily